jgi:alpha-tubulin suppressor-like RCC1 family protein
MKKQNQFLTLLLIPGAWLGASIAHSTLAGTVVAWGDNSAGQTSVPIAAQSGVKAIASGLAHTVALKNDGSVLAWGRNDYGQATVPPAAQNGVTAIAAGLYHAVALRTDSSLVAWGWNGWGQTTVPFAAQSGVLAIAAGTAHTVALKDNGSVVAWGYNGWGETTVPPAAQSGVVAIAAGDAFTVALKTNGMVVAWGVNQYGQTTVPEAAQSGVVAISAGDGHTVALKDNDSVVAWGHNYSGQTTVPVAAQSGVVAIAAGSVHTVALKNDGSVVAWGDNSAGQTTVPAGLVGATAISAGGSHTVALVPTTAPIISTQPVSQTVMEWASMSFTVTATSYHLTYQWRKDGVDIVGATNADYSLTFAQTNQAGSYTVVVGNTAGSVTSAPPAILTVNAVTPVASTPGVVVTWTGHGFSEATVPETAQDGVVALAVGEQHVLALKDDGSVVSWGANFYGEGTVPVTAQSGVVAIAAGLNHSLALKDDGLVIAWGSSAGSPGDFPNNGQSLVPAAAQSGVVAIAAGASHSMALKIDGSVVTWGETHTGQTSVPLAARSGIRAIATGGSVDLALRSDGSVVVWGSSWQSDVPVAAQSGVVAIAAGSDHRVALKNDGSVVAWGDNSFGQTTVPVEAQSGVVAIAAGALHTAALKTNGVVVVWGLDCCGQMFVPATAQSQVTTIVAGGRDTLGLVPPTAPVFITQPLSQDVVQGWSAQFTSHAEAMPSAVYFLQQGGSVVGSASSTGSFILRDVTSEDGGDYTIIASNYAGVATSTVARLTVQRAESLDLFTELFDAGDNDLAFSTLTFTPNGSVNFYSACREAATNFPTDPAGGYFVPLGDDDYVEILLTGTNTVGVYSQRTNVLFIGSNGYLTMGYGDDEYSASLSHHFDRPRVSALFDDLSPEAGGSVSWKELSNLVAITYQNVPHYDYGGANSFQIEMFFDGRIRLTYLVISARDGLAGLSAGQGVLSNFFASDLSSYFPCVLSTGPAIFVQQPLNAYLTNGVRKDFGGVFVGRSNSLTFTIKNLGTEDLTDLSIVIDGSDAAMFTVTANPVAFVAPGGSTTFTVRFAPTSAGVKSGGLHIMSNDSMQISFDILLTGTGGTETEPVFTDWTSLDLINNVAFGTLDGTHVTFFGDTNLHYSVIDGSSPLFACTDFSPQLALSDFVYFSGTPAAPTYSFVFEAPVRNPVIHLSSLASQGTFGAGVERLSGSSTFDVTGSTVSGVPINGSNACGGTDASGSIRLDGTFCSLSFKVRFGTTLGDLDGIYLQLGGTVIHPPQITVSRSTNSVLLSFASDAGISYQVEYSPVLPAMNWLSLGLPIDGDGTTKTVSHSTIGLDAQFYRVHMAVCQ